MKRLLSLTIVIGLLVLVTCCPFGRRVTLRTREGQIVYQARVPEGELAWIMFNHSVNKSLVEDGYAPGDGFVTLTATRFRHYGAGIPDPEPGQTFSARDGYFEITGYDTRLPVQWTFVGRVADHRLRIGEDGPVVHYDELAEPGTSLGLSADSWSVIKEIAWRGKEIWHTISRT